MDRDIDGRGRCVWSGGYPHNRIKEASDWLVERNTEMKQMEDEKPCLPVHMTNHDVLICVLVAVANGLLKAHALFYRLLYQYIF